MIEIEKNIVAHNSDSDKLKTVPYDEILTLRFLNILIAEDNYINQLVLKKMLEGVGHTVEIVVNSQEACDILIIKNFDLIIMDVHMPIMDGLEATEHIRRSDSKIPILGCTADTFSDEVSNFKTIGMNDVVVKPIHLQNLLVRINGVLNEEVHSHKDGSKLVAPVM